MGKVLLIGGSPMIGKSTIAKEISKRCNINYLSTDDIGEALQAVIEINPMKNQNFLRYYAENEVDKLIDDICEYHKRIEPAIQRLIDVHSTWGNDIIMEGWAIYPHLANKIDHNKVSSIWLIAENHLIEKRVLENNAFNNSEINSKKAVSNYLARSFWHNAYIKEQCNVYDLNCIEIKGNENVQELSFEIIQRTKFNV